MDAGLVLKRDASVNSVRKNRRVLSMRRERMIFTIRLRARRQAREILHGFYRREGSTSAYRSKGAIPSPAAFQHAPGSLTSLAPGASGKFGILHSPV